MECGEAGKASYFCSQARPGPDDTPNTGSHSHGASNIGNSLCVQYVAKYLRLSSDQGDDPNVVDVFLYLEYTANDIGTTRAAHLRCPMAGRRESSGNGRPTVSNVVHKLYQWRIIFPQSFLVVRHTSAVMSSANPGRVAIIGTGSRGLMFVNGIAERPNSIVVALCDQNAVRSEYYNEVLEGQGRPRAPIFKPEQFGQMLVSEKVDTVVITTVDATHHLYIIPALKAGGE